MATILIVDDNTDFCTVLQTHLEQSGHQTATAYSARAGLARIGQGGIDVVLTDILMPEVDGIELLRAVKQRWPGLPVIAMSGGGQIAARDLLDMINHLGADGVLQKPVRRADLLAAVDTVLGRPRS
ncbi:response regulator [Ferrovibrio sp.]|uniref:response regulator n=1 Tax=Ferrovibrio sp. TaxID=1917215 RepID=UPI0031204E61